MSGGTSFLLTKLVQGTGFRGTVFHVTVIHTLNFAQVKSMDDNCGEWVECMGVASGCGEQEAGVASGSG